MKLRPLTGARKLRDVAAYDMEWVPGTLELRVIGVYDERGYRHYSTIAEFLKFELVPKNCKRWYYAHSGGKHDVQFIVEHAMRRGIEFEAAFAGSSAIIVSLRKGRKTWKFIDSYHLFNVPLDNVGEWIGLSKGAQEQRMTEADAREYYRSAPLGELIAYNERDCEILWRAIHEYQCALLELGGQLRMTQASCAMDLFRRRYLRREIEVSSGINEIARQAYYASRVEVFASECCDAQYYDINSSFSAAMIDPLPANPRRSGSTRPTGLYLAHATIEVGECWLPPLPARIDARLYYPTGRWTAWFTSLDLELLEREGHQIVKIWDSIEFEEFTECGDYAQDLYERKERASGFERAVYKLALNSLYGKFGESPEKQKAVYDPPNPGELRAAGYEPLVPGLWLLDSHRELSHAHVPIAAFVTSRARRQLYDPMARSNEVYYCDTDGFATDTEHPITTGLGGLKLEKDKVSGRFLAPKLYCLDAETPDGEPLEIIAAKGFSRIDREQFEHLADGGEVEVSRMRRLRELWRRGDTEPTEETYAKGLRQVAPKRHTYPDGTTRPWNVAEIVK